jgi:transcriptional regulator with XRE-family HTH domain
MVKQNPMIMKQPDLGLKIVELRKAKGLTQEELVERCNINVRTIQRIEAGEVTPRSYTIKSIMGALGYDFSTIPVAEEEQTADDVPSHNNGFLKTAFLVGILYLMLALLEGIMDFLPILNEADDIVTTGHWYAVVKICVIVTYTVFMLGYYKMGVLHKNELVMLTSIFLILATAITLSADIYVYYAQNIEFLTVQIFKSVVLGAMYVALGIGLLKYQAHFGSLALVTAVLGIVSGLAFLSVIFALPGLTIFTVFEILQLVLLYKAYTWRATEKRHGQFPNIAALNNAG